MGAEIYSYELKLEVVKYILEKGHKYFLWRIQADCIKIL